MFAVWHFQVGGNATEFGGEVAQTIVGEGRHDHADVRISLSNFDCSGDVAPRRDTAEDTLLAGQATSHFERFIRGSRDDAIQVFYMEHLWNKAIADAFDFMRSPRATGEDIA